MKEKKHPGGRPSNYNQEIAIKICDAIASSTLGIRKLCQLNPDFPDVDTIFNWRYKHKEFAEQYNKAKVHQAELLAEDIIDIADDGINDTYINDDGKLCVDSDVIQRSRLRVDARKWVAAKLLPKVYGDNNKDKDNGNEELKEALNSIKEVVAKCLKPI